MPQSENIDDVAQLHVEDVEGVVLDLTVFDQRLVASISCLLSSRNIPCVLWGNYLLTIYGVPTIVDGVDFLVPDELVAAAATTLSKTGLLDCKDPTTCSAVVHSRSSPPPAAHLHMGLDYELTVSIYKMSSAFWFLPSFGDSKFPSDTSSDFILATDPRLPSPRPGRGHGAFQAGNFHVCIPTAHRLLESYIRIINRGDRYRGFYMSMVNYIEEYVDGDGFLDEEALDSRCRAFYSGLKANDKSVRVLIAELKADFTSSSD